MIKRKWFSTLIKQVSLHAFFCIACFIALLPILYAFSMSINDGGSLLSSNFSFIPKNVTLANYVEVFTQGAVGTWFVNTFALALFTVICSLAFAIPAAYVFSRWRFGGRNAILRILLLLYSFPSILSMFAMYRLMSTLGLVNTHVGLLIIYIGTMAIFALWNMKGYFDTIPVEIEEAGKIDGCTDAKLVWFIVLPLARPSIIVSSVMIVNFVWNEYIFSMNFLTGEQNMTLASGLYSLQATEMSGSWPVFAAASLVVSLPVLVIFFLTQKYMTSGLTAGGVKG